MIVRGSAMKCEGTLNGDFTPFRLVPRAKRYETRGARKITSPGLHQDYVSNRPKINFNFRHIGYIPRHEPEPCKSESGARLHHHRNDGGGRGDRDFGGAGAAVLPIPNHSPAN